MVQAAADVAGTVGPSPADGATRAVIEEVTTEAADASGGLVTGPAASAITWAAGCSTVLEVVNAGPGAGLLPTTPWVTLTVEARNRPDGTRSARKSVDWRGVRRTDGFRSDSSADFDAEAGPDFVIGALAPRTLGRDADPGADEVEPAFDDDAEPTADELAGDDVSSVSAHASPGIAKAVPAPRNRASAPTRPTIFAKLWRFAHRATLTRSPLMLSSPAWVVDVTLRWAHPAACPPFRTTGRCRPLLPR